MKTKTLQVRVAGRVQGVFFRDYTARKAQELNLVGYVRNLPTGQVEAIISGTEEQINVMLSWLEEGSPLSRVDEIRAVEYQSAETFSSFSIRY